MSGTELAALITAIVVPAGAAFRWLMQREFERGKSDSYRAESEKAIALKNEENAALRAQIAALHSSNRSASEGSS